MYCAELLFLNKLKAQINRAPDTVTARYIYQQAQAVGDNTYSYIMAAQELEAAEADVQLDKKPGPNNLEEAELIKQVKIAVNKFTYVIHTDFVT